MDKETIQEQIEILIATLKEQHEGMKEHPKFVPQIDVDLFLENIRDLYEFSIVLGKMNERDRNKNQAHLKEIIEHHPHKKEIPIIVSTESVIKSESKIENSASEHRLNTSKEKKANKIISGILFEDNIPSEEPIMLQKDAVLDLKMAIGINQKFVFMNELFDGSLEEYNASIDLLNNCQNASEAEQQIFLELQPKYHWDMNNGAVKNLIALVERRFS